MWLDGQLIIDRWVVPTVTSEYFALPMYLTRGIHALKVEFFDSGGDAMEQLYWLTATMAKVLVPAGPLQPPTRGLRDQPRGQGHRVPQNVTLQWGAGGKAVKHDIYFGTDANAVAAATTSTQSIYQGQQAKDQMSFTPGTLEWDTTYYWRIDEVNDAASDSPWKSSVWSFTTADFLTIDDMESYNDDNHRIYDTWVDGLTDGKSNSQVGYDVSPFAETAIVHGGKQSMPMSFDNSKAPLLQRDRADLRRAAGLDGQWRGEPEPVGPGLSGPDPGRGCGDRRQNDPDRRWHGHLEQLR